MVDHVLLELFQTFFYHIGLFILKVFKGGNYKPPQNGYLSRTKVIVLGAIIFLVLFFGFIFLLNYYAKTLG